MEREELFVLEVSNLEKKIESQSLFIWKGKAMSIGIILLVHLFHAFVNTVIFLFDLIFYCFFCVLV